MEDPMLIVEEICTDACGDGTCNMECGEDSENCPLDCSE
jgi:hypothetical protein